LQWNNWVQSIIVIKIWTTNHITPHVPLGLLSPRPLLGDAPCRAVYLTRWFSRTASCHASHSRDSQHSWNLSSSFSFTSFSTNIQLFNTYSTPIFSTIINGLTNWIPHYFHKSNSSANFLIHRGYHAHFSFISFSCCWFLFRYFSKKSVIARILVA
jgi:hypothetical protein